MFGAVLRFLLLLGLKVLGNLFYRVDVSWVENGLARRFDGIRVALVLNHTSLFEPLYVIAIPLKLVWKIASQGVFPGADITMGRPIVGRIFRMMAPGAVSISRQRDETWTEFLGTVSFDSLVLMTPEGRMKRPGGLDKHGKPMTVRGGIADVLEFMSMGRMLILYSGGLHHVHTPGQKYPRPFQKLAVRFEVLEITDFKRGFSHLPDAKARRVAISRELDRRRDLHCPDLESKVGPLVLPWLKNLS